jgi:hypothetical protein
MEEVRVNYLKNVVANKKEPTTPSELSVISAAPSLSTVIQNIKKYELELKDID